TECRRPDDSSPAAARPTQHPCKLVRRELTFQASNFQAKTFVRREPLLSSLASPYRQRNGREQRSLQLYDKKLTKKRFPARKNRLFPRHQTGSQTLKKPADLR